jgi:ATP-dependent helicase HrpB
VETGSSNLATGSAATEDVRFRRAVLAAYPDRVARRRAPGSGRFLLASGGGARLGRESGVHAHEFIVAVDVVAAGARPRPDGGAQAPDQADAVIRMATGIERDWLAATAVEVEHRFVEATGDVRALRVERYGAIVLREVAQPADPVVRAGLLAEAYRRGGHSDSDQQLLRRLEFAGIETSVESLVEAASLRASRLTDISLAAELPHTLRAAVDREAPADLRLPSGRRSRLIYTADGRVMTSVKLQELFGLADSPRVGPRQIPVTFELLAPNGRPVQVTSDLRSFWMSGYPAIRRQLRGRYPRHPWPEDPWTAPPTHRTTRRT